jgi:hypothetical protein
MYAVRVLCSIAKVHNLELKTLRFASISYRSPRFCCFGSLEAWINGKNEPELLSNRSSIKAFKDRPIYGYICKFVMALAYKQFFSVGM